MKREPMTISMRDANGADIPLEMFHIAWERGAVRFMVLVYCDPEDEVPEWEAICDGMVRAVPNIQGQFGREQ